jgi:hypothetical protein
MRKALTTWLVILLAALQMAGCGTGTTITPAASVTLSGTPAASNLPTATLKYLAFQRLDIHARFDYDEYCNLGAQVHLMTDFHSLPDLFAYPSYPDHLGNDREKLNRVEFASYSVVFAFKGDQDVEGPPLTIEKIWCAGRTLYVQAGLDRDNPAPYRTHPLASYRIPFDAVTVSKTDLPASGALEVVLLDQDGTTLATNAASVPPPADLLILPVAFLPVMREPGPPAPGPLETLLGTILLEDDYLWLVPGRTGGKYLIIWPRGCYFQFARSGEYEVYYEPYAAQWQNGVEVGAPYHFQGCKIDAATAEKYIGQKLPPGCGDSFWFVYDIEPVLV